VTGPVNGGYELHGELTLRHVTQPVTARAVLVSSDPRTLEVSGELTFDVRDFQLDPPKMLGLRVYPEVAVSVRIVAAADNDQTRS
jgi:polyisoprenoid-binding protein YceI